VKCPRCNAWALVLETRAKDNNTMRRRYECGNLHRFWTIEQAMPEITERKPERNKKIED
jgi:transcriptional regulator NrdR family protein